MVVAVTNDCKYIFLQAEGAPASVVRRTACREMDFINLFPCIKSAISFDRTPINDNY